MLDEGGAEELSSTSAALLQVEQRPASAAADGESSRQTASLPGSWRLCGFRSFLRLLVQILSSFLKTRRFLGCLLVFPQWQRLFLTDRPIAGAELNI